MSATRLPKEGTRTLLPWGLPIIIFDSRVQICVRRTVMVGKLENQKLGLVETI